MAARILVADDSVTIQKVVELTFSKEGFVLVQARSGEEAIRKAKEERPDLVLLDLVMPDKNGYEVCAALRAEPTLRAVPVILLAGTFEAFDKDKGIQAGANDFVTKPFESQVLISKVKQLLFAKTMDMAAPAAASTAAPPREAPRPAPGIPPRPVPASGLPPGRAPGAMRGVAPTPPPPSLPPSTGRTLDLSPPSEEISQDRVRSVVEPPPSPAPPQGGFGELNLEDLPGLPLPEAGGRAGDLHLELEKAASGPVPVPEELSLEMPPLVPEPAPKAGAAPAPVPTPAGLPESLSLEEVLSAEPPAAPPGAEGALAPLEEPPGGPVFDLTSEMGAPSLPLVEVGSGEPPELSIEDLLAPAETAPRAPREVEAQEFKGPVPEISPEGLSGGPVFGLTDVEDALPPALLEAGGEEPSGLSVEGLAPPKEGVPSGADMRGLPELELELTLEALEEAAPSKDLVPDATAPLDLEMLVEVPLTEAEQIDLEAAMRRGEAPVPPPVVPPVVVPPSVPAMEAGAAAVAPPEFAELPMAPAMLTMEAVPPAAAAMPPPGAVEAPLFEMAAMRQAVTERVAHELARDLSDKLLERIERIVWEVVPDLAEILITKEIERIRSQAEGKQST
jgi:CheY-like chemotaxis protein